MLKEKKVKDQKLSSSRSTQKHAFIRILRFFEGGIGVARIAFSLERLYYGRIFLTEFGATIFADFYLFFLGQRENNTEKKLAETQSMKIQVKSGEIPVCKNVGKMKPKVDSRRLAPKSAKLTCYPILKI